jgi:alkylation response protein AidB-like acyl-CoA dehydrogenase
VPGIDELQDFRTQVRAFVAERAPRIERRAGTRAPHSPDELAELRGWAAELFRRGYLGADWPKEWGGDPDWDLATALVVEAELARADAPDPPGANMLVAHALLGFGSDQQRLGLLPRIRSYDDLWCQLFSEPGAGSDLGGLRTRAIQDGGTYRITGQKVWSTNAHWADWGFLLARTDPHARSRGITAFALDMRLPGVEVRPLREMTGTADFNEVFLDGVEVPADAVLGGVNDGWRVANACLAKERIRFGRMSHTVRTNLAHLVELCRDGDGPGAVVDAARRDELGGLAVREAAFRALTTAGAARENAGLARAHDPMIAKLMFSELNLDIAGFGLSAQGPQGMLGGKAPGALDRGRWQDEYLYSRAYTIAGGSSEIMRNLLAERGLGLPRG